MEVNDVTADSTHPEHPDSEQPVGRDRLCTFPEPGIKRKERFQSQLPRRVKRTVFMNVNGKKYFVLIMCRQFFFRIVLNKRGNGRLKCKYVDG